MAKKKKKKKKVDDQEAVSSSANAPVLRGNVKKKECKESFIRIQEAVVEDDGRKCFPVTIIEEGLGNLRDRNFYTEEAIKSAPEVYEGKPAYYDHPDSVEEKINPNRRIQEMIGHYEDCKSVVGPGGVFQLVGKLYPIAGQSRLDAVETLEHSVQYKKKYPDKDFVGLSINGGGEGESLPYDEGIKKYQPKAQSMAKLKQIEGEDINFITKLTDAFSADVVTLAGAGGKLNTQENAKARKNMLKEAMKKILSALERKDYKGAEAAAKDMLEKDPDPKDDKDKDTDKEAEGSGAVKKMLNAMKAAQKEVGDKKEGEDEAEYEAKMEKALKAALDKKEDESEDETEDEAEEGKDSETENEEDGDTDDGDDDNKDKKGGKGDISSLKKAMQKQAEAIKSMQDEMEEMKKEKKENQESVKNSAKEAAEAKTKLNIKERKELIDGKLSECGQPMRITKLWRPVLEKCLTEKEMDSTIKDLLEAVRVANAERFMEVSDFGAIEREAEGGSKNDDLFLKD